MNSGAMVVVDNQSSQELGYRENPPDMITYACLGYMTRITELRAFIGFFFGIVDASSAFAKGLTAESKERFKSEAGQYAVGKYNFSAHRQLVNEILLSRAVETFDLYLLSILRSVFEKRPEMLSSEAPIEASKIMELKTFDEIVFYLTERKLHDLSFKPLSELRKFFSKIGVDIFKTEEIYETALIGSEVRNLIAHNDCRVNDVFRRKVGSPKQDLPISDTGKFIISDEWVRRTSYTLDNIVFDLDELIAAKFGVERRNRFGLFILRQ